MSEFTTRRFQRLLLAQTISALVLVGVVAFVLIVVPIGGALREMEETNLVHQAELTAIAIEAEIDSMVRVARQIPSRTQSRLALLDYLSGGTDRQTAADLTHADLVNAVAADRRIIGVRRYLPNGRLLVEIGRTPFEYDRGELPWVLGISDPKESAEGLVVTVLVTIAQRARSEPNNIGYDEVFFLAGPIEEAMAGPTLIDQTATVQLLREGEVLVLSGAVRTPVSADRLVSSSVADIGPGWTLRLFEPGARVSARVRRRLVLVIVLLVVVIAIAATGTWRILRRLSGRLILETNELSRLVDKKTGELQEANKHLVAANRAKSAFLSSASHELRTPLSAVLGFLDLIEDADAEEKAEYVRVARDSGRTMLAMVNDLLDLSAIESGSLTLREAVFSPAELCGDVLNEYLQRLGQKGLDAVFYVAAGLPEHVLGDAHRYRQIVENLVDNAYKYTAEGHIAIGVEPAGELVRTTVMDTGPGIGPDEIEHIFEPFHRATDKKLYRLPGLGLGLGIVDRLARAMGGTVHVNSQANSGSTFVVDVRLDPQDHLSSAEPPGPRNAPAVDGRESG